MVCRWICVLFVTTSCAMCGAADEPAMLSGFVKTHCLDCHDKSAKAGELRLDEVVGAEVAQHAEIWEKVVRKLNARQMPPKDAPRPAEKEYVAAVTHLETALDAAAAKKPNAGRTETFRRLN